MKRKAEQSSQLAKLVRAADDRKYYLLKSIYELPDLSYDRGSQQGDYEIRDRAQELLTGIDALYNALKLFDNGKSGDVKAYEDILIFFQNSFIDTFLVMEKFNLLKLEIDGQSGEGTGEKSGEAPGGGVTWNDSAVLADLKQKLNLFETRIVYDIAPRIRLFLDDVNRILMYEKIRFLVDNSIKSFEPEIVSQKSRTAASIVTTYLWLHRKINPREDLKSGVRDFAAAALRDLGLDEILLSKAGMRKAGFEEMLDGVANDFGPLPACDDSLPPAIPCQPREKIIVDRGNRRDEASRLVDLVNELCSIGIDEKTGEKTGNSTGLGLKEGSEERFLFHSPGSFADSLKSVAEYMNDSLIFVFTYLLGEIRKRNMTVESAGPLLKCVPLAEKFTRSFREGLVTASDPGNQSQSLMGGEIKQYVTLDLARDLHGMVLELGRRIDEAFIECYIGIYQKNLHRESVLMKKLKILHDSFNNALTRVYVTMEKIKI